MIKQPYTKPPLSVQAQIALLKSRGLQIPDEPRAARYLQNISYYRLSGYMYPFLADTKQHLYKRGTVFEDVLGLYRFDRELRITVFAAIEKIEIALRAQIINQYSITIQDPFWYTKAAYFEDPVKHAAFLASLTSYINRSNDMFIKHFYSAYSDPYPPIWVIFEILSMGQFSILYKRNTLQGQGAGVFCAVREVTLNYKERGAKKGGVNDLEKLRSDFDLYRVLRTDLTETLLR